MDEWVWQKQLRFYYESGQAVVRMGEGTFSYKYEYQGNAPKLVYTPLTDKAYLTLTQVYILKTTILSVPGYNERIWW